MSKLDRRTGESPIARLEKLPHAVNRRLEALLSRLCEARGGVVPHRILEHEADVGDFTRFLGKLQLPVTVEWVQGRDRTRDQNALQFLWANEVATQLGDRTAAEVQREWKLRYGVPILREDSAEFREIYDQHIKPLAYEAKIKVMEFIPVTSLLKVRQMVRFLDTVQRECLENGIKLTDPDPALATYQARYRLKETA